MTYRSKLWEAFLIDVQTGQLLRELDPTDGSWSDGPLNDQPMVKMRLDKTDLPKLRVGGGRLHPVLQALWERCILPWTNGLLLCYGGKPLVAGPIIDPPVEKDLNLTLEASGIEALLENWIVLRSNYQNGDALRNGAALQFKAGSLGYLAWLVVEQSLNRNGRVPIVNGVSTADGTYYTRTYDQWNLQNNGLWKRLLEITNVIDGPDIAFRPEWVPGKEYLNIQWRMVSGTKLTPYIPQPYVPIIDLTTPGISVTTVAPVGEWTPVTTGYGHGSGEGAGMLISVKKASDELRAVLPPLELAISDSGTDNWSLVDQHTQAKVNECETPTVQTSVSFSTEDSIAGINRWWTGDSCEVVSDGQYIMLPEGQHSYRCINRSGKIGETTYKIELQGDPVQPAGLLVDELNVLQLNMFLGGTQTTDAISKTAAVVHETLADVALLCESDFGACEQVATSLRSRNSATWYAYDGPTIGVVSKYPIIDGKPLNDYVTKVHIDMPGRQLVVYSLHLEWQWYAPYLPRGYGGGALSGVTSEYGWSPISSGPITDTRIIGEVNINSGRPTVIQNVIQDATAEISAGHLVLMGGDYNEPSHLDWTPETNQTYERRGVSYAWDTLKALENAGWVDGYRKLHPNPSTHPGITWPANNVDISTDKLGGATNADNRDRIDFIHHPANSGLTLLSAEIIGPKGTISHLERQEGGDTQDALWEYSTNWPTDHKGNFQRFRIER